MAMIRAWLSSALVIGALAATSTGALAQRSAPPAGTILGPSMMGPLGFGVMCSPRAAGYSDWRIDRIERAINLSERQRSAFETLKTASKEAEALIRAACPAAVPSTSVERLKMMEARFQAALQSVSRLRPAFESFYEALDSEQKAKFDTAGSNRWRLWPGRKRQGEPRDGR